MTTGAAFPERPEAPEVFEIGPRPSLRSWLHDLWEYRAVLVALSQRDIRSKYKQALLGFLWAVIQPVVQVGLFSLVFRGVAGVETQVPYPVFLLSSLLPFNLFQQMVTQGAPAFVTQQGIITKIYFPRIYTVMAAGAASFVNAAVTAGLLVGAMVGFEVVPSPTILLAVPFLLCVVFLAVGIAALFAAANARFRDIQHALPLLMSVLMFVSPVLYPLKKLPRLAQPFAALNPVTGLVDGFRYAVTGTEPASWGLVWGGCGAAVLICCLGVWVFERMQARMVDYL